MASIVEDFETSHASPQLRETLRVCADALQSISTYELDPVLNRRMRGLGERKDALSKEEYEELLSLISFSEQRTREKLEAQLALRRLRELVPGLTSN
jgi:hypothetical protein